METTLATRRAAVDLKAPFRLLLAAMVLAVAAGATVILAPSFSGAAISQADGSYDRVEQIRGQVGSWITTDSSYDQVEKLRLQVTLPNQPADTSYDRIEQIRGQLGR